MPLPTLNLIGPGRLGLTLARLWQQQGLLAIAGIRARQAASIEAALSVLGAGTDCNQQALPASDLTLIATPDDAVASVVAQLLQANEIKAGSVVFHASGALASNILAPLRERGALVASVHPLKSFASHHQVDSLQGTWCGCEGDTAALAVLAPLFDALGAHRFSVDAQHKTLYHAAAVLACNDLVALMETALRCMSAAGVPREQAWPALRPLIDGTLSNLDRTTPAAALTGPIARGDLGTVTRQLAAVDALDPAVAASYRSLGQVATQLAQLNEAQRGALNALLQTTPGAAS